MTSRDHTILLCDDDASIRMLAKAMLAAGGYEFREATDADGAIASLDASPPTLLLLDLGVPGDGRTVLEHVRGTEALSAVKVLLVTGAAGASASDFGTSLGADGHLIKPFTLDGLQTAVREQLAG
ncbi:MAG: response regulator [Solirubrobacteraceae bacterium]|nr:response regulator [Solirubrobacteraceae bacterium]